MPDNIEVLLRRMPKVDLHCHLDGSVRVETIRDLARKTKANLPMDLKALKKLVSVDEDCRSLGDFLRVFEYFYPLLKSAEAVERIAYELVEDASRENIKHNEVRLAPALQATPNFSMEQVVQAALKGLAAGSAKFKTGATAILICYRSLDRAENMETVRLAEKYLGKGVVALDLAGDESRFPIQDFSEFFELAKSKKIPFTIHAGEAAGPESIEASLNLGASRIGHGVRLIENPALLERIRKERIPLEVCITSNVQTQVVSDFQRHPVRHFFDKGLRVTLNTDDRGVSDLDLTHEYLIAHKKLGFTEEQLRQIALNGVESLFLSGESKSALRKSFEEEFATIFDGQKISKTR